MRRMLGMTALGLVSLALSQLVGQNLPDGSEPAPYTLELSRQGTATVADGYRVFVMLAQEHGRIDSEIPAVNMEFNQLRHTLISAGLISRSWCFHPSAGLERDVLAYMTASYLNVRPGLLTSLLGMTRRYAYREMQFRRFMKSGQPHQIVSGAELLSVMTRVAIEVSDDADN